MRKLIIVFFSLLIFAIGYGQRAVVYTQLPADKFKVSASSELNSNSVRSVVDGAGMIDRMHNAHNLGRGMWVSKVSKNNVRYNKSTHIGIVWFSCDFGEIVNNIDLIKIWNYNQAEHTRRGLKKVYIEYSLDGISWLILKNKDKDYHILPESQGRNPENVSYILKTSGLKARYICFTADADGNGNYYDKNNPIILQEAADMHQNINYYGLSEIQFFKKETLPISKVGVIKDFQFVAGQGYLKSKQGPKREYTIKFDTPIYGDALITFSKEAIKWKAKIPATAIGTTEFSGCFPAGYMDKAVSLDIDIRTAQGNIQKTIEIPAARKWTVSFFPHSHLDIGYTHRQDDVMKLQWRNIERALDLADRTKDYPEGSKFKWNSEATWAISEYIEKFRGTEKGERLKKAVQDGILGIDMGLGSILTGISRQEELMHIFDDGHKISKEYNVDLNTAMMSDVPGQVWGFATAMAKNGVKYYSGAPNYVPFYGKIGNDRAAALHTKWGDRPFYWQSQSGTDKVLVWQAGRGYSWFHGWLANRIGVCGLDPIWSYLAELEEGRFPYNGCYLRYTVHGDNGPPDASMPDVIKAWNDKYESPQFKISTAKEFFSEFENKYGKQLPVYGGDMTPTWEDGAASTARETAMNRTTAAKLAQTETLWSMLGGTGNKFPINDFDAAWKNVLLFSEHTWGASASGPDPHSKFTIDLWNGKKMYADSAASISKRLYDNAVISLNAVDGEYIHVLNTNIWNRTDVMFLDNSFDLNNKVLLDSAGTEIEVQHLNDGRWAFIAKNVPALSSAVYHITKSKDSKKRKGYKSMISDKNQLNNGIIKVSLDDKKGTVNSLKMVKDTFEYVSNAGLNDYIYSGKLNVNPKGIETVKISTIEDGAIMATLRVESDSPGCNKLYRDITVYKELNRVDILNTVDKKDVLEHENMHFVFPFNIAHPEITMDLAMSEIHPEREQLAGVNKNYYSLQNGIAVGDLEHVVCLTTIDAPFVELGSASGLDFKLNPHHGYGWWQSAQISPVIYSWVMTNSWRTNYKASQGGIATFRYSVQPGNPFDINLKQRGVERESEMTVVRSNKSNIVEPLFNLTGRNKIAISSIKPSNDGAGYIISLHNMDDKNVNSSFIWKSMNVSKIEKCDFMQNSKGEFNDSSFWMQPYEYIMLKVTTKP